MKPAAIEALGVWQFLAEQPLMSIRPGSGAGLRVEGLFSFTAEALDHGRISDRFRLTIEIPPGFPRDAPAVVEHGRIPRTPDFHVNPDGTLCLGSPLRLLLILAAQPSLPAFSERCLVPYLYAASLKLSHGGGFAFGELAHGASGALEDVKCILGLRDTEQAKRALELLAMRKRRANKRGCPCGTCGRRLGKCRLNHRLRPLRRLAPRSWFRGLHRICVAAKALPSGAPRRPTPLSPAPPSPASETGSATAPSPPPSSTTNAAAAPRTPQPSR